jgi:cytochrome P450
VPERWLDPKATEMQRGFLAFSQGGRACIGRNIAYLEMQLVVATVVRRYDLELREEGWWLPINEAFSAHTGALPMRVRNRTDELLEENV